MKAMNLGVHGMTDTFKTPIQLKDLDALIEKQITKETKHFTLACNLEDCSKEEENAFNMGVAAAIWLMRKGVDPSCDR